MDKPIGPIHNEVAEQGALGCVLQDSNLVPELNCALFYDIRHQTLVGLMQDMFAKGMRVDTTTVSSYIVSKGKEEDVGGLGYVNGLPDKSPSSTQFGTFVEDLQDFDLRRHQVTEAERIQGCARDLSKPALEHQDDAERRILQIRPKASTTRASNGTLLAEINAQIEEASRNPGSIRGLATGFGELDEILCGMKPGQLIVVGGRPGQGKSALMLQIAQNLASKGTPTGYFSLEMQAKELLFRLQCACAKVDSGVVQHGLCSHDDRERLAEASKLLCRLPLYIEDHGVDSLLKIRPRARQLLKTQGVRMLVIDYLQLLRPTNRKSDRYEAVTEVSGELKQLAMELEVPIIVGSQFNRDVEKEARKPRLSDLRDSGSIEQDADVVLLLHHQSQVATTRGVMVDLLVAKNRSGRTGKVPLVFENTICHFSDATTKVIEDAH